MPEFAQPLWLLLLLLLPGLVWLRWRFGPPEEPARRVFATALRCLALALLVLALAGPTRPGHSRHADVVFVLDVSSSLDREARARGLAFINRALMEEGAGGRRGLVVFGADASVERLLGSSRAPVAGISAHVERGATDIARAIEVAAGAFPADGTRRIVLLSDGRETRGRARAAARTARSIGMEISTVSLSNRRGGDEVYVEHVRAPRRVREREPFEVGVTLHSRARASAQLLVMRNGVVIEDRQVELKPGLNGFSVVDEAARAGLYEYEAVLNSERDGVYENNRYQAFVQVRGAPQVLYARGKSAAPFAEALRAQGLAVIEQPAEQLPATLHELSDHELVVLDNVSAFDLSLEKMQLLEEYVRVAGGGLISIGGDRSYAAGGYYQTPIERALPVTVDIRSEVQIPSLAVVVVLDKSASMDEDVAGGIKLDIAKVAALSAVEVLSPLDRVGVLAFDTDWQWSVPLTEVGNGRGIADHLRVLRAGGNTDLRAALAEAYRALREVDAKVKHIIVLSDGLTTPREGFEELATGIADDGMTASTVTFGEEADRELMHRIAEIGGGRYYHSEDMRDVPRIFTSDTLVVARDLFVEGRTRARAGHAGEMLEGFDAAAMPALTGYLRTYPKSAAQVLLFGPDEDPLLASWRYGLGKSVAFMSDFGGRWGNAWAAWPGFSRFAAQMARWSMRRGGGESLLPDFILRDGRAELLVDVLDRDERFVNGLRVLATVRGPGRGEGEVVLEPVAPGRYGGSFAVAESGRYYVTLSGQDGERRVGPRTFGLAVPYSSEYVDIGADRQLLADIAEATGGRLLPLAASSLDFVSRAPGASASRGERIWWPLLLLALLSLLLEVAVRKVVLPASWAERWRRLRGSERPLEDARADYETLALDLARARRQRIAAARERAPAAHSDAAVRARLYHGSGRP